MKTHRLWELDFVRGLAIIGMVVYHLLVDLFFLNRFHLDPFSFPLILLARITALTFLFLVGFSFSLSLEMHQNQSNLFKHTLKRSLRIFVFSLTVTLATYLVSPDFTVRFGILNLISLSLLLLLPLTLLSDRTSLIPISLLLLALGFGLNLQTSSYNTFDYYPLLPWFGIVLLGFALAKNYPGKVVVPQSPHPAIRSLAFLGKHSLLIYLLHQPVLLGFLFLFKG